MEESQFDVIIVGTGLVNSITAAALAKAGYKVAHIDSNAYYGADEASLSLDELVIWADGAASEGTSSRIRRVTRSLEVPSQSRQYSICLRPAVIPSVGPLIASLVKSGVAKYSGFRLLESVSVYDSSGVKNVPGSKEDIFKSKEISLIEKRRLMRFLTFAAGDFEDRRELDGMQDTPFLEFLPKVFSLSKDITFIIGYSLAFCLSATEPTLPTLRRLRNYLRSGGRYGSSPFLIGDYGGIGDIAQGFCRAAAVGGAVYILSRKVLKIAQTAPASTPDSTNTTETTTNEATHTFEYTVDLNDFPDTLSCKMLISSPEHVPAQLRGAAHQLPKEFPDSPQMTIVAVARCILIIDQPLALKPPAVPQETTKPASESANQDESRTAAPITQERTIDTAIVVFPPTSVDGGSATHPATVLINGEGSLSAPKGKWLVYISLPLDSIPDESTTAESLLRPYVEALLGLSTGSSPLTPLFNLSYLELPESPLPKPDGDASRKARATYLVPAQLPVASLPDFPDQATTNAEATFRAAVEVLRKSQAPPTADDTDSEPLKFWPPLPADDDDDDSSEW